MSREMLEELRTKYMGYLNNKSDYLIMDSECSGFQPEDEIIDLAIMDLDGNVVYDSLFKPTKEVTDHLIEIHGITNESLVDKPLFKDEWSKIKELIKDKILITYNGEFDVEILSNTLKKYGFEPYEFKIEMLMDDMNVLHKRGIPLRMLAEDPLEEYKSVDDCLIILRDIIERYIEDYL